MKGRFAVSSALVSAGALVLAGALAASGCSDHRDPGGGAGGHGGVGPGGLMCWGNTGCDRSAPGVVLNCAPGGMGEIIQICDDRTTCSLGSCVSAACAEAQSSASPASIAGCLFYTAALDNIDSDDASPTLIVVTNPQQSRAMVRLEQRTDSRPSPSGQVWAVAQSFAIEGGRARSFTVTSQPLEGPGYAPGVARRVVSDQPVTVMVVQSDNRDQKASSSAGTMLLPVHALGVRYMAMTYMQNQTDAIAQLTGALGGAAEVAIVATQDNTTLRILPPGAPRDLTPTEQVLDQDGDLFQMVTDGESNDLSGVLITADKPVAVFSGNVVTTYGKIAAGISSPDMAMEQMVPISEWSKTYVAARLPAQTSACNTLFASETTLGPVSYWRIVASDQTMLTFSWTGQLDGLPPERMLPATRGLPIPLVVSGEGDFVVHATAPILMTQGMDCEPTLSGAVPVDAPLGTQLFALAPTFEHVLTIVRRDGRDAPPVLLDGNDISDQFQPADDRFSVARKEIPACYDSVEQCIHRLSGAYGLTLRGMDVTSSYATTMATWSKCSIDTCP